MNLAKFARAANLVSSYFAQDAVLAPSAAIVPILIAIAQFVKTGAKQMLSTLKYIQGAIAKKDFVPALTHFQIKGGVIKGYNGKIGLCSPIDLDIEANPKAIPMIKAIQTCQDTVSIHLTPSGRLSIQSGKFKTFIDCSDEIMPDIQPEGDHYIKLTNELLPVLKRMEPFIAEDASRPWARGILFCNNSAFATNNIIMVEHWLGYTFPKPLNIPHSAIRELLRIGKEPAAMQIAERSVTFHYGPDRWLKTQLYTTEWPNPYQFFEHEYTLVTPHPDLFEAVETLLPFVGENGALFFSETGISTTPDGEASGMYEVPGLPIGSFNAKHFLKLKNVADKIDLTAYPKPCLFEGDGLRGVIIGMAK